MKKQYTPILLFGAMHGINDFIAGYLLWRISDHGLSAKDSMLAFILYSLIAFGGQYPAGLLIDSIREIKRPSFVALLLLMAAILLFVLQAPLPAVLCSALASAVVHVCGGAACYSMLPGNHTAAGIFTGPGVLGLLAGGLAAGSSGFSMAWLLPVLLILTATLFPLEIPYRNKESKEKQAIEWHDIFMLTILLAIALRSLLWNMVQLWDTHASPGWIMTLGISAFAGKLAGGYMADSKVATPGLYAALAGAAISLYISRYFPLLLFPGVFLLQSTTPMTLVLLQGRLSSTPALASGLALGIAILLAGIPAYLSDFREIMLHPAAMTTVDIGFLFTHLGVWSRKTGNPVP